MRAVLEQKHSEQGVSRLIPQVFFASIFASCEHYKSAKVCPRQFTKVRAMSVKYSATFTYATTALMVSEQNLRTTASQLGSQSATMISRRVIRYQLEVIQISHCVQLGA
uniref:Uncharacterized protein n=1 Tax=uncultured prokaryote TaxID=198431 RepID=A0A0H5PV54_9ZZZZ|nr:hypothetical protein [uncultured prokaryote]